MSTLGAEDRKSRVGALTEFDKDVQDYVKGIEPELPITVQFIGAVKLCSLDLDLMFTKDKGSIIRFEEVLNEGKMVESIDLSHNNLGHSWLPSVLDLIEAVRGQVKRIDLCE